MMGKLKIAAHWLWANFMALMHQLRGALAAFGTAEGRRGWALVALWGAGIAMTFYAMRSLYYTKDNPAYAFWLGIMAHISVLVVITGFAGLLIKRKVSGKITGVAEFDVDDEVQADTTTTTATASIVTTNDKAG